MRFIGYVAVAALAATQGMGIPPDVNSIFERTKSTVSVKSCSDGDTTIRCHDGNGNNEWKNTDLCMKELGNIDDCYCWSLTKYFAIANNNYDEFKACCQRVSSAAVVISCGARKLVDSVDAEGLGA